MTEPLPSFVQRRKPDWDALEQLLSRRTSGTLTLRDLDSLDRLYRRASADLARAQSFYPQTLATRHLNSLVGAAYASIYRPRPGRLAQLRAFYRDELPRLFRKEAGYIALSAAVFLLGILLGALVVLAEPQGAEFLVPSSMREQLSRKEIWTDDILAATPPGVVSSQIATNNLTVMVSTFGSGLLLGLGTLFLLAFNGVHLGSVGAFAYSEGMLAKLFDFIAAHGPVELSVIVIAGGAGLMLGHALIEPEIFPERRRSPCGEKTRCGSCSAWRPRCC